jgi:hypothetical protein
MGNNYSTATNTLLTIDLMKAPFATSKSDAGAALLLALWALFLLSAMVIAWAININSRLTVSGYANRIVEAEAMASSGADIALNPTIKRDSPNLHMKFGGGEKFDVKMTGECGRLNLNFLTQGEDQRKLQILQQYLTNYGIEPNDVQVMMDSLLDWVSPNRGLHHLSAPEESDDYRPAHAPLTSMDELKKVFGWAEFTSKPGWDQDFTAVGNCGQIDLASASRDVLRALLPDRDDFVDRFLQLRQGPDGIDGTADDTQFISVDDALTRGLGLNPNQKPQIQNLVVLNAPVLRIVSIGKSGDVTRSVEMVVLKQTLSGGAAAGVTTAIVAGRPRVFSWKEL